MNKIILQLLVLGFCITIGQASSYFVYRLVISRHTSEALQCYNCKIGADEDVCITATTGCAAGERCFSGNGTAVGVMDIKMKGCLKEAECDKTTETKHPDNATVYSMVKTCCNTHYCNGGANLHEASGLSLTLATVTALLMAQALV